MSHSRNTLVHILRRGRIAGLTNTAQGLLSAENLNT